jgi:type II secretory pathway component PulM
MKAWWTQRNRRERTLLAGTAALCLALFVFQFVVRPLWSGHDTAVRDRAAAMVYLSAVQEAGQTIAVLERRVSQKAPLADGGLRASGTEAAGEVGVPIQRLQPLESGGVEFWFDAVEAPRLFAWVALMHERFGASVTRANVQKNRDQGTVQAQIALLPGTAP